MTLAQLILRFRTMANDKVEPYFWSDAEVTSWLNEAVREAAVRGRLISKSGDPAVCKITLVPNQSTYLLHPSVYEIRAVCNAEGKALKLNTLEMISAIDTSWRWRKGDPDIVIQEETSIRVVPEPISAGELWLDCYCLPATELTLDTDEPSELHTFSHVHLVDWALHKAFSIPDTEAFDLKRSTEALFAFAEYFGFRPDSGLRRETRSDNPHVVEAFWA